MSSSLASQLAARHTLDSTKLSSTNALKYPPSFIYTPRHAASVSTAQLHSIALNAYDQLAAIDPLFTDKLQEQLLGEQAKGTDRASLTKEENEKLSKVLNQVMRSLGKHMLLRPAGVLLEWLVRRFRVNDLNAGELIALFLPFHSTNHFPSALHLIPESTLADSIYTSLIPTRSSLAPLPLTSLIAFLPPFSALPTARPLLDYILQLPLAYLNVEEKPHRALVGFWLQAIAGYLDRAGATLPLGERAAVLSNILEVIRLSRSQSDPLIASYILLARYSLHYPFEGEALRVIMKSVAVNRARAEIADSETDAALMTTLVVISQLGEGELEVPAGKAFLGGSGWKGVSRIANLDDLLVQLCNDYNAERFMKPFLRTLVSEASTAPVQLELLISLLTPRASNTSSNSPLLLPAPIVTLIASTTFSSLLAAASTDSDLHPGLIKVLNQVYQRWPEVWETSTRSRLALSANDSHELKRMWSVMNLVLSGKASSSDSAGSTGVFLSSSSPDAAVRLIALKEILADGALLLSNPAFVHDTVLARLAEPDLAIAQVILAKKTIDIVHRILSAEEILQAVEQVVRSKEASKSDELLSVELAYLAEAFVESFPAHQEQVLVRFFWGRLIGGKVNSGERMVGWNALKESALTKQHPWLYRVGMALPGTSTEAEITESNQSIVESIASNIQGLVMEQRVLAYDFLIKGITIDETESFDTDSVSIYDASGRLCSLLVLAQIFAHLPPLDSLPSEGERIGLVERVFAALKVERLGLDTFATNVLLSTMNEENRKDALGQQIYLRTLAAKTLRIARGNLIALATRSIRMVTGSTFSWLAVEVKSPIVEYRNVVHLVYRCAHTGTTKGAKSLAASMLSAIYLLSILNDTLPFLVSIFTSPSTTTDLKLVTLQETKAFIEAQGTATSAVDFQMVLPALLVALHDGDRRVREEVMNVVEVMKRGLAKSAATVYARGSFYSQEKDTVKYLDVVDVGRYLEKLVESKVELVMDGSYLATFHASILSAGEVESKKKLILKQKMVTFLVSHMVSWSNIFVRTILLRSLAQIDDAHKSTLLVPILKGIVSLNLKKRSDAFADISTEVVEEYSQALMQPYATASKKYLESSENKALEVFLMTLELTDDTGIGAVLRRIALKNVQASVFAAVRGENRLDLFRRLVRLASTPESRHAVAVLTCLRGCKVNGETIIAFLNEIRLSIAGPANKAAKRGRTSVGTSTARTERLPELVVALETVEFKSVVVTHGLLLALFELLSTLIENSTSTPVDIQYAGQLMLTSLSKVIENVQPNSGITNDSIRMSPVLDLMRASTNPQTSHQALLLLAQLGPLVPEQLVHNVMPIFTFMGSNVLQRDDAYSLRVVERTLESIIPALVKSMKTPTVSRDALIADLRDLLRVFTDAAAHVPRHRRIKLFVRFVETLGAREFLSAVTMLLLDKNLANDATALPLAVVESFPVDIQLATLVHYIEESSRLLRQVPVGQPDAPFLELSASNSDDISPHRQVIALINFISLTLESKQLSSKVDAARAGGMQEIEATLSGLVRGLLDLSALPEVKVPSTALVELNTAISYSLQSVVRLMSAQSFSEAILWLLNLPDLDIRTSALVLLRNRLPAIKPARRGDVSPAVVSVIDRIRTSLEDPTMEIEIPLDTLSAVASSIFADEDTALVKTVPVLIDVASRSSVSNVARMKVLTIIKTLSNRLGSRLIPLAAKLITFAVSIIKKEAKNQISSSGHTVAAAFQIIEGLFTSIPSFIGGQLNTVFSACLSTEILSFLATAKDGPAIRARASLLSTASKKLPAKSIYPAIIALHASLDESTKEPIIGLLDLLNRALRQGKTTEIAESYRPIFKLFLTVFDLRRIHSDSLSLADVSEIEENALGAFVQFILKLNEQTFRPIFLRTYDWAVIDLADQIDANVALAARRTILYKIVDRLLTQLKSIVVPYFSFMLDQTIELLESFSKGDLKDTSLWTAVVSALTKSMQYDENGFWTPLRLGKLSSSIATQLESPQSLTTPLIVSHYHPLLARYALTIVPHEALLKSFNTSVLMLSRSDDLRIKRSSIEALEKMWETLGDGMLGLVPETAPFLAESLEEIEGGVELVTRRLIARIEDHLGESLDA